MAVSIFELQPEKRSWRNDRQRRAWLSAIVGGVTAVLPLLVILLLPQGRGPGWRPIGVLLEASAFWPMWLCAYLLPHLFLTDPEVYNPWWEIEVIYASVISIIVCIALYSFCAYLFLRWRSGKGKAA